MYVGYSIFIRAQSFSRLPNQNNLHGRGAYSPSYTDKISFLSHDIDNNAFPNSLHCYRGSLTQIILPNNKAHAQEKSHIRFGRSSNWYSEFGILSSIGLSDMPYQQHINCTAQGPPTYLIYISAGPTSYTSPAACGNYGKYVLLVSMICYGVRTFFSVYPYACSRAPVRLRRKTSTVLI